MDFDRFAALMRALHEHDVDLFVRPIDRADADALGRKFDVEPDGAHGGDREPQ